MTQTEYRIPAPELRGAMLELAKYPELEIGIDGPAGCIAGETRIYNPITGVCSPVKELYERKEAPIVQTLMGAVQAGVPFRKGVADLYRLTLASGRRCIVTQNHLLLSDNSWIFLSACEPGTRLLISAPYPHPTSEAPGPLVSPLDALRLSQRPLGSQESYSAYSRLYGALLQSVKDSDPVLAPSLSGVHVHNRVDFCEDDQDSLSEHSRQHRQSDRHARRYSSPSPACMADTQSRVQPETFSQADVWCRFGGQSQKVINLPESIALSLPDDGSKRLHALLLGESHVAQEVLTRGALVDPVLGQLMPYSLFVDTTQESSEIPLQLRAYNPSLKALHSFEYLCKCDYTAQWDTVSSIEYLRTDEYFDLHVPVAEHYLAEGIWHHNTGKTFGTLFFVHILLLTYPGTKWLVARKRNTDLAGSALATYRENILDPAEGVRYFGGNKVKPAAYEYPNGSVMIVNGLDKPGKVKSMDFDGIYINEATDCTIEDIEFCHMRLARRKNSALPERFQKLLMDFNPDHPLHFLNLRMNEGLTRRLLSRHEDNPFLWDAKTQDWTESGRRYIGELDKLTGVRLARYRHGIWAASEGTVYEGSWDRSKNVIDRFPIPLEWPRYLCLDFGYTNPFVCGWWARDPDGRLICYREIYMTKRLVEDHVKQIKHVSHWGESGGDPLPREIICDHDAEGRATFERHTGFITMPAYKAVAEGIQAVASQLKPAGDGKPRLLYFRDALVERDQDLVKRKKPTCTIEEYDSYVWKQGPGMIAKEEPVKEDDHGVDMSRYMVARFYLRPTDVRYSHRVY